MGAAAKPVQEGYEETKKKAEGVYKGAKQVTENFYNAAKNLPQGAVDAAKGILPGGSDFATPSANFGLTAGAIQTIEGTTTNRRRNRVGLATRVRNPLGSLSLSQPSAYAGKTLLGQ